MSERKGARTARIARKIKHLRQSKRPKLTQSQLADKVGVEPNTVWRWESAKNPPEPEHMIKLAEFFGVSESYLVDDESFVGPEPSGPPIRQDQIKKEKREPADHLTNDNNKGLKEATIDPKTFSDKSTTKISQDQEAQARNHDAQLLQHTPASDIAAQILSALEPRLEALEKRLPNDFYHGKEAEIDNLKAQIRELRELIGPHKALLKRLQDALPIEIEAIYRALKVPREDAQAKKKGEAG